MSGAVHAWAQRLEFVVVAKEQVNFETVESYLPRKAFGVRYPMRAQELLCKPEGQRAWKWEKIQTSQSLRLEPDDIVIFDHKRYRVMGKNDFSEYGYIEYEIAQDFES